MPDATEPRLRHFPISFFAMVMGLAGLSIAWDKAQASFGLGLDLATPILILAGVVFAVLLALYLTKILRWRAAVAAELAHPIHLNFFPTISISLILLAIGTLPHWPGPPGSCGSWAAPCTCCSPSMSWGCGCTMSTSRSTT